MKESEALHLLFLILVSNYNLSKCTVAGDPGSSHRVSRPFPPSLPMDRCFCLHEPWSGSQDTGIPHITTPWLSSRTQHWACWGCQLSHSSSPSGLWSSHNPTSTLPFEYWGIPIPVPYGTLLEPVCTPSMGSLFSCVSLRVQLVHGFVADFPHGG